MRPSRINMHVCAPHASCTPPNADIQNIFTRNKNMKTNKCRSGKVIIELCTVESVRFHFNIANMLNKCTLSFLMGGRGILFLWDVTFVLIDIVHI